MNSDAADPKGRLLGALSMDVRERERLKPVVAILMLLFSTALLAPTAAAAAGDGDGVDDALDLSPIHL